MVQINDRVFIKTVDGRTYTGQVVFVDGERIIFLDKFNAEVELKKSYCVVIQVEK